MASDKIQIFTDGNFDQTVVKSEKLVLVDFWAEWCGPCRRLAPTVDALASDYDGKMTVGKLNVDENPNTAGRFSIRGIPTILMFKGGEIVESVVGLADKDRLGREQFEVDLRAGPAEAEVAPAARLTGWRAAIGPLAIALVLFSVPLWLNDFWVGVVSQGVALAVLFLTFTVVIGEGGMLSLAQVALAGIGAFTAAKLATDSGWPVWLALLAGAAIFVSPSRYGKLRKASVSAT